MAHPAPPELEHVFGVTRARLVLASGSPRRALLLSTAGFTFTAVAPDVDESVRDHEPAAEYVLRLSAEKAATVAREPGDVVLAADTTVVFDGTIFGKPGDATEALEMLKALSGRSHSVLTGWTASAAGGERFGVAESRVRFHARTADELAAYVHRTAPYDKAGAYAIQGDQGWLIAEVDGSRSNVMGLPIADVVDALADLGVERSPTHGS